MVGALWAPWLQPRGLVSQTSLALLLALGDLEAQWAGLEPSVMPLLGGGPGPTYSGVELSDEGSGDRQIPTKKTEWTQERGKRT
jgi:hypothetical protein